MLLPSCYIFEITARGKAIYTSLNIHYDKTRNCDKFVIIKIELNNLLQDILSRFYKKHVANSSKLTPGLCVFLCLSLMT